MRLVVALLVTVCVSVIVAIMAGFAFEGLGPNSAKVSLIAGVAAAAAAWSTSFRPAQRPRGFIEWGVVVIFVLFALRAFSWVAFTKGNEIAVLSPNNLGDYSIHTTYIRYFAQGVPFWPANPIFAAESLHYPLGVDLFNSLLLLCGVELNRGFVWVGLLGALATGIALWRWGGAFTMAGFLFNGGLAFLILFFGQPVYELQEGVQWKSLPLAMLVTQRSLLYALPVGLLLLWSWRERFLRDGRGLPLWIELLFYATLPLFHLHTFLFLSTMLAAWFILSWCGPFWSAAIPVSSRWKIVQLVLLAFIPATVCVALMTDGFQGDGFIRWLPGWMQDEKPLWFWVKNFGIFPLLVIWMLVALFRRQDKPNAAREAAIALPAALFFLVTCFVAFAPWEWDNTKLMIWCYLALLPPLWSVLRRWRWWSRDIACILLFASGFISLFSGINATYKGYAVADRKELDSLSVSLAEIPATATIASFPTYNHPLLLLGRKLVAGYEGHLVSHGVDCAATYAKLNQLMKGEPGWEDRARELNVDYLYWGPREAAEYGISHPAWHQKAPVAAEGSWGTLYDVRFLRDHPTSSTD